jgi:hypothetical protein
MQQNQKVAIAYTSRGNDLCYAMPGYILKQERKFPGLDVIAALSLWGPATENLFSTLANHPANLLHVVDSDVIPPDDALEKLVENDLDICAGPVFMYDSATNDIHLNVCRKPTRERERSPGEGIEKCYGASFACVLIKKRVLQAFIMAGEKFTEPSEMTADLPDPTPPPDAIFYHKAYKLGFPTFMDWRIGVASHNKYARINGPLVMNTVKAYGRPPDQPGSK